MDERKRLIDTRLLASTVTGGLYLEVELYYEHGHLTREDKRRKRGYYLLVVPFLKDKTTGETVYKSSLGVTTRIEEAERFSSKRIESIIPDSRTINYMIEKVKGKLVEELKR